MCHVSMCHLWIVSPPVVSLSVGLAIPRSAQHVAAAIGVHARRDRHGDGDDPASWMTAVSACSTERRGSRVDGEQVPVRSSTLPARVCRSRPRWPLAARGLLAVVGQVLAPTSNSLRRSAAKPILSRGRSASPFLSRSAEIHHGVGHRGCPSGQAGCRDPTPPGNPMATNTYNHDNGPHPERRYRKVHLAMDEATGDIRAVEFTPGREGDSPALPGLLEQIPAGQEIRTVTGGRRLRHPAVPCRDPGTLGEGNIPISSNGRLWKEDCPAALARNNILRAARRLGRAIWTRWSGHQPDESIARGELALCAPGSGPHDAGDRHNRQGGRRPHRVHLRRAALPLPGAFCVLPAGAPLLRPAPSSRARSARRPAPPAVAASLRRRSGRAAPASPRGRTPRPVGGSP